MQTMQNQMDFKFSASLSCLDSGELFHFLDIYEPNHSPNYRTFITFFYVEENINKQALFSYKNKVQADFLIALTCNKNYKIETGIDIAIFSEKTEFNEVLRSFEMMLSDNTFINIGGAYQLREYLSKVNYLYFTQALASDENYQKSIEKCVAHIISKNQDTKSCRYLLSIFILPNQDGFESFTYLDNAMQENFGDIEIIHIVDFNRQNNFFFNDKQAYCLRVFYSCI